MFVSAPAKWGFFICLSSPKFVSYSPIRVIELCARPTNSFQCASGIFQGVDTVLLISLIFGVFIAVSHRCSLYKQIKLDK